MKKQLLVAAVAALVAGNIFADDGASITKGAHRTDIYNNTPADIWVYWAPVTLAGKAKEAAGKIFEQKDAYFAIKPGKHFTSVHSRDGLKVRSYVCVKNVPQRIETVYATKYQGYERLDVDLNQGKLEIIESVRAGKKGVKPDDVPAKK